MPLLAQAEAAAIATEVVKAMAEHKSGGSLDSFMFLMALAAGGIGCFYLLRWMGTHNQSCIREITNDHKEACKTITETFKSETAAIRAEHTEDRKAFREGVHAVRNVAAGKRTGEGSG